MYSIVENNNVKKTAGRPKGVSNQSYYKWSVVMFDKETNKFKEGKYISVKDINESLGLNLNSDYVRRIMTHYRADPNMRNKENSFLARYGHIKINKIYEKIENKKN
jgi:hypothetical protein